MSNDPAAGRTARREELAEVIAARLDPLLSFLGALFVLVVIGETVVGEESPWSTIFVVAGWAIWAAFVVEFVARMAIAPSTRGFLRRNWWQLIFLVIPFLRFVRILRAVRLGRAGRVISSAVRGGRTAGTEFRSRAGVLVAVTILVVLAAAQLLFEFGRFDSFTDALHAAAFGAITGEPIRSGAGVARVIELALALYSVIVFASAAGILAAYLFRRAPGSGWAPQASLDPGATSQGGTQA